MTREEALSMLYRLTKNTRCVDVPEGIIVKIYDYVELLEEQLKLEEEITSTQSRLIKSAEKRGVDKTTEEFESRTCESCKYYIEGGCGNIIVNCVFPLPIDFGCNKWMAKDD